MYHILACDCRDYSKNNKEDSALLMNVYRSFEKKGGKFDAVFLFVRWVIFFGRKLLYIVTLLIREMDVTSF
jgi:hypothetical protein